MKKSYLRTSALGLMTFGLLTLFIISIEVIPKIDQMVLDFFVAIRNPFLTRVFTAFTYMANPMTIIIVVSALVIVLLARSHKTLGLWFGLTSLSSMVLVNMVLKTLVGRPRPDLSLRMVDIFSPSFPSGHSLSSVVCYWGIAYILDRLFPESYKPFKIILLILPIFIAFSRTYLAVHYFTDILGGLILGASYLFIAIGILEQRLDKRKEEA